MTLDSVYWYLVENSRIYIHQEYWSVIFFLHYSCGFGITAVLALGNELGSVPYSYILWKSLRGTGINSSLKVWFSSLVNLSGPELFFDRRFLITQFILFACYKSVETLYFILHLDNLHASRSIHFIQITLLAQGCSEYSLIILLLFDDRQQHPLSLLMLVTCFLPSSLSLSSLVKGLSTLLIFQRINFGFILFIIVLFSFY